MNKSEEMSIDQQLRLLDNLKDFNHIIMQYFKIGMIGNAKFWSACLGIPDIYDHNMRLAVQVQKEYRESTLAEVSICQEIQNYVEPTNLEKQVQQFFEEYIQDCKGTRISAVGLYETYQRFCKVHNYILDTQTAFGREASKYAVKRRKANGVYYSGISFK